MERQEKVIIDANIGVKWFSEEKGSTEALALLEHHIKRNIVLVVPDLFFYEVINAMRYKERTHGINLKKALRDLYSFQCYRVAVSLPLQEKALELALKYRLTIYDATYLAIAEHYDVPCITEDKKMIASRHRLIVPL